MRPVSTLRWPRPGVTGTPLEGRVLTHLQAHARAAVPTLAATLGVPAPAVQRCVTTLRRAGVVRVVSREPVDPAAPVWARHYRAIYGLVAVEKPA